MDRFFLCVFFIFLELGIYLVVVSIVVGVGIFGNIFMIIWFLMVFKWVVEGVDEKKIDEILEYVLVCVFYIFIVSGLFFWMVLFFLFEVYVFI